jgi:DNA helicase-2/ATP-dependent DNA helicase PcrA
MQKDPQQKQAIEHTGTPLLILAGPGSGKTFTITEKIVELIKQGLASERILALTFSEKAAAEMQERVVDRIGKESGITISTFHSFCNELIRDFPLYLGIDRNVRLITKEHAHVWGIKNIDTFGFEHIIIPQRPYDLINSLLEGVSQMSDHLIRPAELKKHVSRALKSKTTDKDSLLKLYDLALFYEHYQQYKKSNGLIDYDDMITKACELIRSNHHIARTIRAKFCTAVPGPSDKSRGCPYLCCR